MTCHDGTRSIRRYIRTGLIERADDSEGNTTCCGIVVPRGRLNLLEDIGALIETDNINFTVVIRGKLYHFALVMFYAFSVDVLVFGSIAFLLLQSEFNSRKSRVFAIYSVTTDLGDIDAVGVVISKVLNRGADAIAVRIVGISQRNLISLGFTNQTVEFIFDLTVLKDLGRVELCLVLDGHLRASVDGNGGTFNVNAILKIFEFNDKLVGIRELFSVAMLGISLNGLVVDRNRDIRNIILTVINELGRHRIRQFVREDVVIAAIGVDITRNRTDEFIIDPIVHS